MSARTRGRGEAISSGLDVCQTVWLLGNCQLPNFPGGRALRLFSTGVSLRRGSERNHKPLSLCLSARVACQYEAPIHAFILVKSCGANSVAACWGRQRKHFRHNSSLQQQLTHHALAHKRSLQAVEHGKRVSINTCLRRCLARFFSFCEVTAARASLLLWRSQRYHNAKHKSPRFGRASRLLIVKEFLKPVK